MVRVIETLKPPNPKLVADFDDVNSHLVKPLTQAINYSSKHSCTFVISFHQEKLESDQTLTETPMKPQMESIPSL